MNRTRVLLLATALAACAGSGGGAGSEAAARRAVVAEYGAARTIRGRVVDEHGRPVAGTRIHAGVYGPSAATPSGRDGRYVVGVGAGYAAGEEIHLAVRAPGFVSAWVSAPLGARDHVLVVRRGAGVRAALAGTREELEGRAVSVRSRRGDEQETVVRGGRLSTFGLTPDAHQTLEVRVAGFVPRLVGGLALEDGAVRDLGRLELQPGATLEVLARDSFGDVLPGAGVRVVWTTELEVSWFARADAAGRARIEGLPSGVELRVESTPPEGFGRALSLETDTLRLTLAAGGDGAVETVVLRRPVLLRGRLVWGGAGPPPWAAGRQLHLEGTATDRAGQAWSYDGAAPDDGAPLGSGEAAFQLWARPGRWNLELVVRRDGETYAGRLVDLEVPEPARGERSGALDVGAVVLLPTAR